MSNVKIMTQKSRSQLCLEFFNDAMQMLTITFFPTVYSVFAWIAGHH